MLSIKDIVKDRTAYFSRYRQGIMYYKVVLPSEDKMSPDDTDTYEFPVPLVDVMDATLEREEKAITMMRYIRKALDEKTFVKA